MGTVCDFDDSGEVSWTPDLLYAAGSYLRIVHNQWATSWPYVDFYSELEAVKVNGVYVYGGDVQPTPTPTVTPTPTITPTVTPTPVTDTYCCEVVCEQSGGNLWQGTLPVFTVGEGDCVEFPGADLSAIGLGSIPALRVCVAPIDFGAVGILGVEIDLDLMAVILAALLSLRVLWRS